MKKLLLLFAALILAMPIHAYADTAISAMPEATVSDDDLLLGQESGEIIWNVFKPSAIKSYVLLGNAATASALASNPSNCSAGNYPLGIAADGSVESCTAAATQYTDELAQDATGAMIDSSLNYVDGTPLLQRAALSGDVSASAGSNTTAIGNDKITEAMLKAVDSAVDEECLTYETTTGDFEWQSCGGTGTTITLDLGDDGGNDSTALGEIAVTGDTNSIFTESSADKLLIAVGNDWPKADTADDLTCTDCINATEIEDIYVLNTTDSMSGALTTVGAPGLIIGNGATSGGSIRLLEDTDNGSNHITIGPVNSLSGDFVITPFAATDTMVGKATTDTFTNKTIDADGTGNSITNIENADIKAAAAIAVNKLAAVTANRVLLSDASGFLSASSVSNTTLGYLDATSSIQTQIDGKQATLTNSAGLRGALSDETGASFAVFADSPVFTDDFDLAAAGVRLTGSDGSLTILGLGNGNDEDLKIDLDNGTANIPDITSSTGVTALNFGSIDLRISTAGTNSASAVTVGGTQTLTNKTLTSPTLTTPAIGVATGTSLDVSGVLESGTNGGTNAQLKMFGSTSGDVTVKTAAAAGTATVFQLPATNGTNGWFLKTDGAGVTSWAAASGGGGSPGGSDTYVQFNDGSAFGGVQDFTWNKTTQILNINNSSTAGTQEIKIDAANPGITITDDGGSTGTGVGINGISATDFAGRNSTLNATGGTFALGGSTSASPVPVVANVNNTAVGNVGGGTDDLITYSLPATSMNSNGRGVRITAWGTTANNVNAKTLILNFGSAAILTNSLTTSVAGIWRIEAEVFRTGSNIQDYSSQLVTTGTAAVAINDIEGGTASQTDSSAITIKCTGAGTSNNDIVQEGLLVEMLN